jgi:ribosome recycling factor
MDLSDLRIQMDKALAVLADEIGTIKTGRATPSLIEKIIIDTYGTKMPLMESATISAPEPSLLLVTPFDKSIIRDIEKSLSMDRNLGLSVAVDSNSIRLNIPPLTEERRLEFVKLLGQKIEAGRIMIRQIRGEKMRRIKEAGQRKELNEDEVFKGEQEIQKMTDEFNQKIDQMKVSKEAELLRV